MIQFEDRQKTKILRSIEHEQKNYEKIQKNTGIIITSVRGRTSQLRKKGLLEKIDEDFKITQDGIDYLGSEK